MNIAVHLTTRRTIIRNEKKFIAGENFIFNIEHKTLFKREKGIEKEETKKHV